MHIKICRASIDQAHLSRKKDLHLIKCFRGNLPVAALKLVDWQGQLVYGGGTYGTFICTIFLNHTRKNNPHKSITDVFMFDGASNLQLGGEMLKTHYPLIRTLGLIPTVTHRVKLCSNA